ncbi:MAG: 30S ribosomal protein S20 [Candidatus Magasanikbacteria bacterium]|nr:30S ribosomal protein S20 [Candidatus Magasanikbacteria bacterium]
MPNLKNAKKALRRAKKRAIGNVVAAKTYKTAVKTVKKAVVAGETELKEKLRLAQKALDKAAKRGVIKKNTAGRRLSRIMAQINKVAKK